MSVGRSNEFVSFRNEDGTEQFREDRLEAAPQPDVEEVGQVGVANVVVIRRVCGINGIFRKGFWPTRISIPRDALRPLTKLPDSFCNGI